MHNPEKAAARGDRAKELMADALVVEAFAHIDSELWRQFRSVTPSDKDALAYVRQMQYMRDKFEAYLAKVLQDGKLAQMEIERRKKTIKERMFG